MNLKRIEIYARQARRDFIAAVTDQATLYGIAAQGFEPVVEQGDVAIIGGRPFSRNIVGPRNKLEAKIRRDGFEHVMEEMAYTWFNRFAAIRYMELHGYLEHGYRVLSHPERQDMPEILVHAADIEMLGLDREKIVELKLDGTRDEEMYHLLIKAQCNALHKAMPFLFERVSGGVTELLLPTNLLHTDSLIRRLVKGIDESDWEQIEIIGWLYQFYISEKKDQVIGEVVAAVDIPAATQLFTPNWIVQYMVQNSLGAQWLATYPHSPLRAQMEYYIEPAEQTDEIAAQLAATTPNTLNPEELTLIDPASGSGHILVEAYDLFKAIYLERGYRQRDAAQLILEKNLFGLDIDRRAVQLTGFALMMKGRADDRQLFEQDVKLNVLEFVDSSSFNVDLLVQWVNLANYGLQPNDLTELKRLFKCATTFGSLIQVPEGLATKLSALNCLSTVPSQDLYVSDMLKQLGSLVQLAKALVSRYDIVVANPPYMGRQFHILALKNFLKDHFSDARSDLFACFIERGYTLAKNAGCIAMVTMQSWMFLPSFHKMRERLLGRASISTMAHLGAGAFGSISGAVVQTTAFVLKNRLLKNYKSVFFRLINGGEESKRKALANGEKRFNSVTQDEFKKIPGSPVAYWVSASFRRIFEKGTLLGNLIDVKTGVQTANNDRFLRHWHEVDLRKCGFDLESRDIASKSGKKWFPHNKGGEFRKWYGNQEYVVNWEDDGREIRAFGTEDGRRPRSVIRNSDFYFLSSVTWSRISSSYFGVRYSDAGAIFDVGGSSAFPPERDQLWVTGFLCSKQVYEFMRVINPTLTLQVGSVAALPVLKSSLQSRQSEIDKVVRALIGSSRIDWNAYERSWNFQALPILTTSSDSNPSLEASYNIWLAKNRDAIAEMKCLEEENNRLFINAYGLSDEITPDVPVEQITLTTNPAYRYGGNLTEEERWTRLRQDTMAELVSFGIGCTVGRYSLDKPGLIYAHSGNIGFDPSHYTTFPADDDGIIPLTEYPWFDDDATQRLIEFISVAWDKDHLEDNLAFLANNLLPKKNETSRETLRRYLCNSFFGNHLQTYKKRPIYWLFSSGKLKAFQCLVYLHRYNEGTLARMRTEYVIPLQGMMASRIRQLEGDVEAAVSTTHRSRMEKERAALVSQLSELQEFDVKLRHYADQRITLDLDDGVKSNYGKFGNLLAEVKKVTGTKAI